MVYYYYGLVAPVRPWLQTPRLRTIPIISTTRLQRAFSPSPCDSHHPLVDISALKAGCQYATSDLRRALFSHGYFYATNVAELPATYIQSLYVYSARCHSLSLDIKRKYRQRDGGTGAYSGPDIGQPELQYEAGVDARVCAWDYSRAQFSLASTASCDEGYVSREGYVVVSGDDSNDGGNVDHRYPATNEIDPPFATVLDDCYTRQNALARVILGGFERALDLPSNTLLDMFETDDGGDFGTIRLLHYPGCGEQEDTLGGDSSISITTAEMTTGISAHTDFECFTLMHQSAPGLQILPRRRPDVNDDYSSGGGHYHEWMDMPVRPAEFVVIIGDMLERLTNGALLATPHRVLPMSHKRDSIIRFNAFAPSTVIAPLRPFVSVDRPVGYSPVLMKTHMEVTMKNLEAGKGSWDPEQQRSISARWDYGGEWRVLEVNKR